ncbi:carbohydrate ABC transporter permease [Pseudothermotoga sp.]
MNVKIIFLLFLCTLIVVCSFILGYFFFKTVQVVKAENLEEISKVIRSTLQAIREKVSKNAEKFFHGEIVDTVMDEKDSFMYVVNEAGKPLSSGGKTISFTEDLMFNLMTGDPVPMIIVENSKLIARVVKAKDMNFDSFFVYEENVSDQLNHVNHSFAYLSNITKEMVNIGTNINLPFPEKTLKAAQSAWNPVSASVRSGKKHYIIAATPFLDYLNWHAEGVIVVGTEMVNVKAEIAQVIYFLLAIGVGLVILCSFVILLAKKTLFSSRICSLIVLTVFLLLTFFLKGNLDKFSERAVRDFTMSLRTYMKQCTQKTGDLEDLTKIFNLAIFDGSEKLIASSTTIMANLKKDMDRLSKMAPDEIFHSVRGLKTFTFKFGETKLTYLPLRVNTQGKNLVLVFFVVLSCLAFMLFILDFLVKNIDNKLVLRNTMKGYSFLLPGISMFMMWLLIPIAFSLYLSFHEWSMVDPLKPFVGFENFMNVLKDKDIMRSLKNTAIYTLNVPIGMALSLGVALLMNKRIKGINLLRLLYFLPSISSFVAISIVWQWIYNPEFGLLNYLLGIFRIPPQRWLSDPKTAMMSIMIMTIWMNLGYQMVIYLAGLKGIPSYLYEVADLDGANSWHKFVYITLPMLKPTTVFLLITSVIGSFQIFTPVYVMTEGGPAGSTNVFVYHIYNTAWKGFRMGYASAQSWFLFLLIFIASFIQFRLMGKTFYEE